MYILPIAITFVCAASVAVALRLFTRIHLVCSPGWDDWFLLLALLVDYAFFAFLVVEIHYGLGVPQSALSPAKYRSQLKALWISIPMYNLTLNLTKVSIVLLYLRLFTIRTFRIVLICVLVFVIVSGLWLIFSTFLECIPIRAFWDKTIPHYCLPETVIWSLNAALQITSDLIIVLLPMPSLIRLRIPIRQKLALIFVFALGLFVCVTSIIRLHALLGFLDSQDISHGNGSAATWSFVESNVAIICASLPVLRPLIMHVCPRLMPSRVRSSSNPHDKSSQQTIMVENPFDLQTTSYSANVTGNCSASIDGGDSGPHRYWGAEGIQVVSELRLDLDAASDHSKDGCALPQQAEPVNSNSNSTESAPSIRFA